MKRFIAMVYGAAIASSSVSSLFAATIYWQGGSGALISANYTGASANLTPTSGDVVNFGAGGTATHAVAGTLNLQKLRVGHNQTTPAPGGGGTGNVTINNGAVVNLTVGAAGLGPAGCVVAPTPEGLARNNRLNTLKNSALTSSLMRLSLSNPNVLPRLSDSAG